MCCFFKTSGSVDYSQQGSVPPDQVLLIHQVIGASSLLAPKQPVKTNGSQWFNLVLNQALAFSDFSPLSFYVRASDVECVAATKQHSWQSRRRQRFQTIFVTHSGNSDPHFLCRSVLPSTWGRHNFWGGEKSHGKVLSLQSSWVLRMSVSLSVSLSVWLSVAWLNTDPQTAVPTGKAELGGSAQSMILDVPEAAVGMQSLKHWHLA